MEDGFLTDDLQRYLQQSRDSLLCSLDGLPEYEIRRPVMSSGTNLLGLVKHLIGIETNYLGDCVARPAPIALPWVDDGTIWESADMWATAEESRDYIIDLYLSAAEHSDESIAELPLDAPAHVHWWAEDKQNTTFGHLIIRVVAETAQHAGHADIVREIIDGRGGDDHDELGDETWWAEYLDRIQSAADRYR